MVVYSDAKNCGLSVAAKDTLQASSEFLWKKVVFEVSYLLLWNESASMTYAASNATSGGRSLLNETAIVLEQH